MRIVNTNELTEISWSSPKGTFSGFGKEVSEALGRKGVDDLILYVVADNPLGESNYYPDSDKWAVRSPHNRCIRSEPLDYFDGEE